MLFSTDDTIPTTEQQQDPSEPSYFPPNVFAASNGVAEDRRAPSNRHPHRQAHDLPASASVPSSTAQSRQRDILRLSGSPADITLENRAPNTGLDRENASRHDDDEEEGAERRGATRRTRWKLFNQEPTRSGPILNQLSNSYNNLHWNGLSKNSYPFVDSLPPAHERIHVFIPIGIWNDSARWLSDIKDEPRSRCYFTLFVMLGQCLGYATRRGTPGTHILTDLGMQLEKVSILINLIVRNTGRCDFTIAIERPDSYDLTDSRNHVGLLLTISINDPQIRLFQLLKDLCDDNASKVPEERRRYVENTEAVHVQVLTDAALGDNSVSSSSDDDSNDSDDDAAEDASRGHRRGRHHRHHHHSDHHRSRPDGAGNAAAGARANGRNSSPRDAPAATSVNGAEPANDASSAAAAPAHPAEHGRRGGDADAPEHDRAASAKPARQAEQPDKKHKHVSRRPWLTELKIEQIAKTPGSTIESIISLTRAVGLLVDTATHTETVANRWSELCNVEHLEQELTSGSLMLHHQLTLDRALELARIEAQAQAEELRKQTVGLLPEQAAAIDSSSIQYTDVNSLQLAKESYYISEPHQRRQFSASLEAQQAPSLAAANQHASSSANPPQASHILECATRASSAAQAIGAGTSAANYGGSVDISTLTGNETMAQRIEHCQNIAALRPEATAFLRETCRPLSRDMCSTYGKINGPLNITTMMPVLMQETLFTRYLSGGDEAAVDRSISETSAELEQLICQARIDDGVAPNGSDGINDSIDSIANYEALSILTLTGPIAASSSGSTSAAARTIANASLAASEHLIRSLGRAEDGAANEMLADETQYFIAPEPELAWKLDVTHLIASRLAVTPMPWCPPSVTMHILQTIARYTREPIKALQLSVFDREAKDFGQEMYESCAERLELPRAPQASSGNDDWSMLGMDKDTPVIQSEIAFLGMAIGRAIGCINARYDACVNRAEETSAFDNALQANYSTAHRTRDTAAGAIRRKEHVVTEEQARVLEHQAGVGRPRCMCGMSRCLGGLNPANCYIRQKFGAGAVVEIDSRMRADIICALRRVAIREMSIRFGPTSYVPPSVTRIGKFVQERVFLPLTFDVSTPNIGIMGSVFTQMMIHVSAAGLASNQDVFMFLMCAREAACLGGVAGTAGINVKIVGPYGVGKSIIIVFMSQLSIPNGSVQLMGGASGHAILPIHEDRPFGDCIVMFDELPPIFTTALERMSGDTAGMFRMLLTAMTSGTLRYKMTQISGKGTSAEKMGYVEKFVRAILAFGGATNSPPCKSALETRFNTRRAHGDTENRSAASLTCATEPSAECHDPTTAANELAIPSSTIDLFYNFNALSFIAAQAIQCRALPVPDRSMLRIMLTYAVDELKNKYGAGCALNARALHIAWPMVTVFTIWRAVFTCFAVSPRDPDAAGRKFMYQHISMLAPYMHACQDEVFATIAYCISQAINPMVYDTANWMASTMGAYSALADFHKRGLNACDDGLSQIRETEQVFRAENARTPAAYHIRLLPLESVAQDILTGNQQTLPFIPADFDAFAAHPGRNAAGGPPKFWQDSAADDDMRKPGLGAGGAGAQQPGGRSKKVDPVAMAKRMEMVLKTITHEEDGSIGTSIVAGAATTSASNPSRTNAPMGQVGTSASAPAATGSGFLSDSGAAAASEQPQTDIADYGRDTMSEAIHMCGRAADAFDSIVQDEHLMRIQQQHDAGGDEYQDRAVDIVVDTSQRVSKMDKTELANIDASFSTPDGWNKLIAKQCNLSRDRIHVKRKAMEEAQRRCLQFDSMTSCDSVPYSRCGEDVRVLSEAAWRSLIAGFHVVPLPVPWKYKVDNINGIHLYDPNYISVRETVHSIAEKMTKRTQSYKVTHDDALGQLQNMCNTTFDAHLLPRVGIDDVKTMTHIERYRVALWHHASCRKQQVPMMIADRQHVYILIEALVLDPITIIRNVLRGLCNGDTFTTRTVLPIVSAIDPALYITFEAENVPGKKISCANPRKLSDAATNCLGNTMSKVEIDSSFSAMEWGPGSERLMLHNFFQRNGLKHPELQMYEAQRHWKQEHFPGTDQPEYPFPVTNFKASMAEIISAVSGDVAAREFLDVDDVPPTYHRPATGTSAARDKTTPMAAAVSSAAAAVEPLKRFQDLTTSTATSNPLAPPPPAQRARHN